MIKVCVFCASSEKIDPLYRKAAAELADALAELEWGLVYGGSDCGLMKVLADGVMKNGGEVLGIIPQVIADRGKSSQNITRLIVAKDMKERKSLLREASDAFIALPGGWGTWEEMTEVITLKQLGEHNKPILFLNICGFYDRFFDFVCHARNEGFISGKYDNLFVVVNTVEEAVDYIQGYKAMAVASKY